MEVVRAIYLLVKEETGLPSSVPSLMYILIDCLPNQQYVPDSAYLQEGSPSFTSIPRHDQLEPMLHVDTSLQKSPLLGVCNTQPRPYL
jgi:hypothetical protein